MLVVVSPAKKLMMDQAEGPAADMAVTEPQFSSRADELAAVARKLTTDELQGLMSISENLAVLNAERFAAFGRQDKKPAALAFAGDTYQGLEAQTLEAHELSYAQDHLRILSGLYGVLRPMDAIEAYRLEMGSKLQTDKGKSLYEYWGADIAAALMAQITATKAEAIVNCASQEYFGAVDTRKLTVPVVTPVFKEVKEGQAKIVSFFAKKARGAMARYMVQNQVKTMAALKDFAVGGYRYEADLSDATSLVFLREQP